MRRFYRWMRKGMAALFVLGIMAAGIYYLVYTVSGIVEEIEKQTELRDRTELMVGTATALAPTIQAESMALAAFEEVQPTTMGSSLIAEEETLITEVAVIPTTAAPLPSATATEEILPSATSTTGITASATLAPSDTDEPTETRTPRPTATDSSTPRPSATATEEIVQLPTLIPTNTARPTAFPTNTPRPSATLVPTETFTPTITLTPSLTFTPSLTPTETVTLTPSRTPTATTSPYPFEGTYATPMTTPITDIPPRAALVEDDPNIVNVMLLGSDNNGQTDVVILVSINRDAGTVSMWHIPRDVLFYIPGYTVDRINRAFAVGNQSGWEGGGVGLVKETLLYNLGIEIDFYARVNFDDFQQIIGELGGLEISVDCELRDWALISPELDQTLEESWEQYTLGIGRKTLSPYYALWYARSRLTTNDPDRGRRQMDVLRAIWHQSRSAGLLEQITSLWPQIVEIVETDMELTDAINFAPLATGLELQDVERFSGVIGVHYENWTTPDDGRAVLLPNWAELRALAQDFVTPPSGTRLERDAVSIEIYDGSAYGIGFDLVAADRLAWEGFGVIPMGQSGGSIRDVTIIYDYTGSTKGSALERIMDVVRVGQSQVIYEPDPNRTVDFRIEMGRSYNSCIYGSSADDVGPPLPTGTPPAGETPAGTEAPIETFG